MGFQPGGATPRGEPGWETQAHESRWCSWIQPGLKEDHHQRTIRCMPYRAKISRPASPCVSGRPLSIWVCPFGLPSEEPYSELSYLLHEHFQLCMNQLVNLENERIMQCQEKVDPN